MEFSWCGWQPAPARNTCYSNSDVSGAPQCAQPPHISGSFSFVGMVTPCKYGTRGAGCKICNNIWPLCNAVRNQTQQRLHACYQLALTLHCLCLTRSRVAMGEKKRRACRIYVEPCRALLWEDVRLPPVPPVRAIIQASPAVSWSRAAVRYCWGPPAPLPCHILVKPRLSLVKPRLFRIKTRLILVKPFNPFPFSFPYLLVTLLISPLSFLLFSFSLSPLFPSLLHPFSFYFPFPFLLSLSPFPFSLPFTFNYSLFAFPPAPFSSLLSPFHFPYSPFPYFLFPTSPLNPLLFSFPFPLSLSLYAISSLVAGGWFVDFFCQNVHAGIFVLCGGFVVGVFLLPCGFLWVILLL